MNKHMNYVLAFFAIILLAQGSWASEEDYETQLSCEVRTLVITHVIAGQDSYVSLKELQKCRLISRRFKIVCDDPNLWLRVLPIISLTPNFDAAGQLYFEEPALLSVLHKIKPMVESALTRKSYTVADLWSCYRMAQIKLKGFISKETSPEEEENLLEKFKSFSDVRVTTAGPSLDDLLTCYTDALICSFLKRMTVCKARVGQKVAIAKKDHDVGEMTSVQMSRIRRWEIGLNDALNESEEKLMTIKDMFPHLDNYNLWVQCFKAIDPINQALEIMEQGLEESASPAGEQHFLHGKKTR